MILLRVENLTKTYPSPDSGFGKRKRIQAVTDVSLTIDEGETLGLVGESGSGKSTLGRIIVGLEKPDSGEVYFRGRNIAEVKGKEKKQLRTDLQIVFQDPWASLNPRKRIYDTLSAPMLFHRFATKENVEEKILDLLNKVGLSSDAAQRYPHEFSGGQRQRIGIARALALQPKLIVADEPVSALDVSIRAQILNLLDELQEELNLTLLFIAHGLASIKYLSDRIAVMYCGRIVEIAETEALFSNTYHPYTKALIASSPVPDPYRIQEPEGLLAGEIPSNVDPPTGCYFHPRCSLAEESCCEITPELTPVPGDETHLAACPITIARGGS
jgi:oligopeptide transport system ATP-binding protein